MNFDLLDHDSDKDLANIRILDLDNGNKIKVTREDPYGFWYVSYEKGQIPESLKGSYTSFDEAQKAINTYLINKKREVTSAKA